MLSERKKCIRLSERKYYTRPHKKWLIGLQKYTCHLKKTAALDLGLIFSSNIVQSYLCCRPWKQRHLQLYQCQTLSEPPKTLIHKTDTMGVFYSLRSTKPENSRPRCAATHGHKFLATCEFLIQICVNLRSILQTKKKKEKKKMPLLDPSAHDLQNPKIAKPKNYRTRLHAPP